MGEVGGGGGRWYFHIYELCRYVLPQGVWFLGHFSMHFGIDFNHFGSEV